MTRRDRCAVCSESVGDWDVKCDECGESFHSDCPTPYNAQTRLALLQADVRQHCGHIRPTFKDIKQFVEDIKTNILVKREVCPEYEIKILLHYFEKHKDLYENKDDDEDCKNKEILSVIRGFFNKTYNKDLPDDLFLDLPPELLVDIPSDEFIDETDEVKRFWIGPEDCIPFICRMCDQDIDIEY
jgi:hypothetical protein